MIEKAIIPETSISYLSKQSTSESEEFYPFGDLLPKEFLPLGERVLVDFLLEEIIKAKISKALFVLSEQKKLLSEYLKKLEKENYKKILGVEKDSKERKKEFQGLKISVNFQRNFRSEIEAIFKGKSFIKKDEGFVVLDSSQIFFGKKPVLEQIERIFQTSKKPVVALVRVENKENSESFLGVGVEVEKIANRLYKIKKFKKRISPKESDLSVGRRFVLTLEVFNYSKEILKLNEDKKESFDIYDLLNLMLGDGKVIYGWEVENVVLDCFNKMDWLKSSLRYFLEYSPHKEFFRDWLKRLNK